MKGESLDLSKFQSPMSVSPKAKQLRYEIVACALYLVLSVVRIVLSCSPFSFLPIAESVCLAAGAVYLTCRYVRYAARNVASILPAVYVLGVISVLFRVLDFIFETDRNVLWFLLGIAWWCGLVYVITMAVWGRYKLLVPMAFLFFGFFGAFIRYDLRDFLSIVLQVVLYLLLWFPIDSISFTLYVDKLHEKKKE